MNRTDRLYAIVEELRAVAPGYRSTTWLADEFEVSGRTIERDLSALQQSGVPIRAVTGRRGGYTIDVRRSLPPLNFTAAEVTAIATALAAPASTPFHRAGRSALQKVLSALGEADADGALQLADRIRLFGWDEQRPRPPAALEDAIAERRVVELTYADQYGASGQREVEPLAIVGLHPNWYLWAWCRLRDAPRTFRLDRITAAEVTDELAPHRDLDANDLPELPGRKIL